MSSEPDLVVTAGFSDAQLVREANKVVEHFRKRGEQAEKAFQDAQGRVTNTRVAQAHMREMDRLSKAYDPVYRAAKQYEKTVKDLDRALDIGAVTQEQYTAKVGQAAKQFNAATGSMEQAAGRMSRNSTALLQQFGWQVGDFAVQFNAGTSAVQAFSQQAPQLLGAMGAWGAVAGAVVAVTVPLGAALAKVAFDTETLDDRLKKLNKTTEDYAAKAEAAAAPIEVLRRRYGDLADEVARANSTMALLASIRARTDLMGAATALGRVEGTDFAPIPLPGHLDSVQRRDLENELLLRRKYALEQVAKQTKATEEQVKLLDMAFTRMATTNSPEAVLRDSENLLKIIAELTTNEGANLEYIEKWATPIRAVMEAAQTQIRATRSELERVTEQYQTDTEKLKSLSRDREVAQKMLDDAIRSGATAAIRLAEDRLRLVDSEITKTQQLALANDELFQAMQRRLKAAVPQLLDGAVESVTGSSLTQWGKDLAASQKGILDLIASRESGGDYNATLDNGRWTGGQRDLVNMTLREILALQSTMRTPENRALYGNGAGSSALGRYQITGRTLEGLISELGLSGDELFSRDMQDRLATQLVRRRLPQGVEGLRNEWEGLRHVSPAVIQQALGQQSITRLDPELQREQDQALKDQIRERERLAKQAKDYGDQLAANLLSQQEAAELAHRQAEQVAAIRAQGLAPEAESRAIAQITAEIEQQRTVLTLLAEAKRRNVDLDAMLADGSMTYRQAIEALGAAKAADIVATNDRALAESRAAEAQQLMATAQERTKQGLLDSIIAGKSFADVLGNVAQMLAKAAMEAALFNSGPWASGSGGGLLGGLFSAVFGAVKPPSFEGGGFTGHGARVGGIDGHGGFPAILHPNERVIDYTRGQADGGQSVLMVDLSPDLEARILTKAEGQSIRVSQQTASAQAKALPGQVQRINAKPRRR